MLIEPKYYEIVDLFEVCEILQIFRYDKQSMYCILKIKFKNTSTNPKDIVGRLGWKYIEVLSEDNQKEYVCFSIGDWIDDKWIAMIRNPEILLEPPMVLEDNSFIIKFISTRENIDALIKEQKRIYNDRFKILSITYVYPNKDNLHLLLTKRQKNIAYYAVEKGYYEIPRKIDSKVIADKFDISQSAVYDHLRKIQRTIFHSIFK